MHRSVLFVNAAVIALGVLAVEPIAAQENSHPDLSLSVVGIGAKDYAESLNFYTKVMGLRPAFSFRPNEKATFTYLQLSRDASLELQSLAANTPPSLTHIHMRTGNVDALVARLRNAGLAPCTETLKMGCIGEPRLAQPTKERNVLIVDPSGIRIEPTQFIPGSKVREAVDSWKDDSKAPGTQLLVVGIAVKDYPDSQNFYEKIIGFPAAFKFTSPDGQRTTTYYQISRDTFLEMQLASGNVPPGITHVHMLTRDLDATIARLHQAGLPPAARAATTPDTVTEAGITQPSNVKSANVFDPNGLRLELNEWLPGSLTKKAVESWK